MAHITQDATNVYIHLTIPKANDLPARVMAAMVGMFGPIPTDMTGVPIMTEQEFAYQQIRKLVVRAVREWESRAAAATAGATAQAQADIDTQVID